MSRKQLAAKEPKAPLPSPSTQEQQAIERARMRVEARSPRVMVDCPETNKGAPSLLSSAHCDQAGWLARLEDVFGTRGTAFLSAELNRLMNASRDRDGNVDAVRLNGLLAMIQGAAPQNEVQTALAVQMALSHAAVETVMRRALRVDQIPQFDSASNAAVKLMRTFALQAETLAKLQRGGEQVVKVVHVHAGAQAIVGNVLQGNGQGRGGDTNENSNQPHAKDKLPAGGAQTMPEVWRTDPARDVVQFAGRQR